MADILCCPNCGHDKINCPTWGSAIKQSEKEELDVIHTNIDWKANDFRCEKCEHEGNYSEFRKDNMAVINMKRMYDLHKDKCEAKYPNKTCRITDWNCGFKNCPFVYWLIAFNACHE